jgi:hypothetical protein
MASVIPSHPRHLIPSADAVRRVLRLANVVAIVVVAGTVALAMSPHLAHSLGAKVARAGDWLGGLGSLTVLGGLGVLVLVLVVVSVSTEREFSEKGEFYDGH